jgi:3,4-dihydroxy 2-butanone 4-phosphate synthase
VIETGSGLVIEAAKTAAGLSPGGSVNVNGTCVSAVETAHRSTLGDLAPGATVNLEMPLRVGDILDGHLVQGHTDAIGKVTKVDEEHGASRRVWIRPPKRFLDEIVAKGSVAVDDVSLTVAEVLTDRFSVALIPLTLAATTLAGLQPEQRVNLESDLFVKSAHDRAATIRRLAHPDAAPAGLPAVAAICEVMGPDGHMLTGSAVERFALAWSLPLISIAQLAAHLP